MTRLRPVMFDPYRAEFTGCHCLTCRNVSYAASRAGGDRDHQVAASALLAELKAGTHVRVEWAAYVAQARAESAARIAEACAAGRSEAHLYGLKRGYFTSRDDPVTGVTMGFPGALEYRVGSGIGTTPGRHAMAMAAWRQSVDARMASRSREVGRLVAADRRNLCTYFRVAGQVCSAHAELHAVMS